jgi:PAS domain S-box
MPTSTRALARSSRYLLLVSLISIVGIAVSVGLHQRSRRAQADHIEAEFVRRAEIRHALTREVINYYISAVYALKGLFEGSGSVERAEFRSVATEILDRYPGIAALQWVPIVPASDRARIENTVTAELGRPFEFTRPSGGSDSTMVRAPDRPEHLPILFVEPLAGNERALGFDVQNAPTLPFLEQARTSGQLIASEQFALVQGQRGIVIACPVFHATPTGDRTCIGFVQGVFRIDEMIEQSYARQHAVSTDTLYIDDTATDPSQRILYFRPARGPSPAAPVNEADFRAQPFREYVFEFGSRRWIALYRPAESWLADQDDNEPGLWLFSSLLVTFLIASLVAAIARRTAIVERLVAERTAELEESRRQLDNLVHALPGMAFRARYDKNLTVLFVSEGAHALTGCRPEEFISGAVHFRDLTHPEDLERVRTATRAALDEKRDFEIEYRIRPRTGREKWVLSRGRGVYAPDGQLLFIDGLAIDVTDRKQAEAAKLALERKLLESQKLESLGLLAGGIAHDFNNLLTGIMGHASLARHRPDIDPATVDHLRKIESGATRAADLCQQMLAYSGRGQFLVEPVDLSQIVTDTLPLLKGTLSPRARVELALSPRPTVISADATQIRQIVMNLILNAGESLGAAGGEIIVASGRRHFDSALLNEARMGEQLSPGEYVFFEVRDNGCGMGVDTLAKIFDPFFTTKFTGRGLGLAAVLGIVRAHAGALHVRSDLGLGSTFTLIMPPAPEHATVARSTPSATPWQQKGKILVVDDEAPVREVAAQLIATFGFTVVTAADGAEGIAQFGRDPHGFDLVFLDLTMPGLDGEETLAALRAINPGVRVLLVSGYSENDRVSELARRGPLLFLQKPFTRRRLQEKLREILG